MANSNFDIQPEWLVKTTGNRLYRIYSGMISRCCNSNTSCYPRYGGRGITVCDRWLGQSGFFNFVSDMSYPDEGNSLDRVDNDGNYYPENCRWTNHTTQGRNKSNVSRVIWKGESRILLEVCEELNLNYDTVVDRIKIRNWPIDKVLGKPTRVGFQSHLNRQQKIKADRQQKRIENKKPKLETGKNNLNRAYRIHQGILGRCYNDKNKAYSYYGGRGITICDRWRGKQGFENFVSDMGNPVHDKSLDRIDVNGNYEPNNCRWATPQEQGRNKRDSLFVFWEGQKILFIELCEKLNVNYNTAHARLMSGWPIEKIINTPTDRRVIWNGKHRHLSDVCREHGLSYPVVQSRVRKGMSIEDALNKPIKKYVWNGKSLIELCKEYNLNYGSVHKRIKKGMSIEEALNKPMQKKGSGVLYKGKIVPLKGLCCDNNIAPSTVEYRLSQGMDLEKALTK